MGSIAVGLLWRKALYDVWWAGSLGRRNSCSVGQTLESLSWKGCFWVLKSEDLADAGFVNVDRLVEGEG